MSIIYDMTGGRILTQPNKKSTDDARYEIIPGLAVVEDASSTPDDQPLMVASIHLVRALLNKC